MNAPRFMREYAAYAKKEIMSHSGTRTGKKINCDLIDEYVAGYERGTITLDEAMDGITRTWKYR